MVVAPGGYDCIAAKLIEQAGYGAVYMSSGCTAAMLGFPEYGLTTMSEMVDNAGRIANAVSVPVIADADTGFGNELRCQQLAPDALLLSSDGHKFARHSVSLHAPDSELHGVLSRERESEQLKGQLTAEQSRCGALKSTYDAAQAAFKDRRNALNLGKSLVIGL